MRNKAWRVWAKTIGSKISDDESESDMAALLRTFDMAALLRTFWVLTHLVACFFIIIHNGVKLGWF